MPADLIWRHVVISARCTWLPGGPRGFRSKQHRIHSSGDYKNPPPVGEHKGLHRYHEARSGPEVHIPVGCRALIGRAFVQYLRDEGFRPLLFAVGKIHTHGLIKLPRDCKLAKQIVGEAKRKSSRAVKKMMPGSIWAHGGSFEPLKNRDHARNLKPYFLEKQGADTWTWSYEDGSDEGMTTRERKSSKAALPSAFASKGNDGV